MKCKTLFSRKNKKNITNLSSAESAYSMVSVKQEDHCMQNIPFVLTVAIDLLVLASQSLIVLSPLAVTSWSGCLGCQHNWSTLSPCPLNVISLD